MVLSAQDDLDTVRQAAEQGDATAQFNLGVMYAKGEGVPQDDAEAVRWFRLSAEQGHASSQGALGGIVKLTHHKLRQTQDIVSKTTSEYSMGWLGPSAIT